MRNYFGGGRRVVFQVQRAVDIIRTLRWSQKHGIRIALSGASEAWRVADDIAKAKVPVFIDSLANLPGSFDKSFASDGNAARLHAAGVSVSFSQSGDDASPNARKIRQLAGNAVARGMSWDDVLAALTRAPAEALGVAGEAGSIAVGQRADLVLWSGAPLDVAETARQVWMGGKPMTMTSPDRTARPLPVHERKWIPCRLATARNSAFMPEWVCSPDIYRRMPPWLRAST